ncbi:hypothetical protein ACLBXO_21060 [Methylobacterium sp. C33D]|uniref:hypothetical protein n=1 Tax=Methylobacterium mesophilicum TaxID=39956 RepID=UPI002F35B6A2
MVQAAALRKPASVAFVVAPDPVNATLVEETFGMIPATLAAERSPFAPLRAAEIPTQPDSVRA